MQRSGAAAILMGKNIDKIKILFPKEINTDNLIRIPPAEPFDNKCIEFLNALSFSLNKDPRIKKYPDVATFAFFCRKANILQLKKKYFDEESIRLGRGVVFHISPSNVPVNFAYSFLCGLLAGNTNIVRVPSKEFEQVEIITEAIEKLSREETHKAITSRLLFVQYDRQSTATNYFSSICDVRIIWGGNTTIEEIRKNAMPARSFDITFADRYSFCVINADNYISEANPEKVASGFYNDTYLFDQNACTAPHLIIWLGSKANVENAQKIFWDELYKIVKAKYLIQPVIAVDKLTSFYNQSLQLNGLKKTPTPDNLLWRVELKNLPVNIDEYRCSSGYFSEYHASSLSEIIPIINRKYQTLSYWGLSKAELIDFVKTIKSFGIDRIVPIGHTTDFSIIWDGFDLINILSRSCAIM